MLTAIVAMSENNVIGKDNGLLWHLPEDLRRFRNLTTGHHIIMGRKTFDSLPCILPNRHHIVLSRDTFFVEEDERVTFVRSIGELLAIISPNEKYFVIGGGEIYRLLLPLCDTVHMTIIHRTIEGDTTFPLLSEKEWTIAEVEQGVVDNKNTLPHRYMTMKRAK